MREEKRDSLPLRKRENKENVGKNWTSAMEGMRVKLRSDLVDQDRRDHNDIYDAIHLCPVHTTQIALKNLSNTKNVSELKWKPEQRDR